jgi:hypothetical protein
MRILCSARMGPAVLERIVVASEDETGADEGGYQEG